MCDRCSIPDSGLFLFATASRLALDQLNLKSIGTGGPFPGGKATGA